MSAKTYDTRLTEIIRRLVDAYEPERIYLFGSHARGDAGPDSDFDLLVIVPDDAPMERKRSRLAYQVLRGTRLAVDVLVWTRRSFESRLRIPASLPAMVEREGQVLYAAITGGISCEEHAGQVDSAREPLSELSLS